MICVEILRGGIHIENTKWRDATWVKRRWLDFRKGDQEYTRFFISLANTAMLLYLTFNFGLPMIVLLGLIYGPVALTIGWWSRTRILRVQKDMEFEQWTPMKEMKDKVDEMYAWMQEDRTP